ncbi:MAG: ABC transporter permease [Rhodanobacteraceae bacterium]
MSGLNKVWAVVRREYVERVRSKAFLISTLLLPVMIVFFAVVPAMMMSGGAHTTRVVVVDASGQGLGARIAESLGKEKLEGDTSPPRYRISVQQVAGDPQPMRDQLIARVDKKSAQGEAPIDGVLVVSADTEETGKAGYYGNNVGSMKSMQHLQSSLGKVLAGARLAQSGIDASVVSQAMRPADLSTAKVSDGKLTGQSGAASFMIAYFMGFILYIAILIYGQRTMTSVIEEKTSRIMEVLASSLTPFQMLLGKVLGVGAAGLTQMVIWGGTVFLITTQRAQVASLFGVSPDAMQSFPIPTMSGSLLVIFLLYFVLGFLLYGALYAAIGAMCNTIQETQQYATFVTMGILVGFFAVFALINNPNGDLGVTMSFIPFFSPFTMPVRWSLAAVPISQLLLSLALMVVGLLACVWLAGRIYRTGILMYGKKPTFRQLLRWLRTG